MRYLINIYVTTWEWLEDRRGRTAALDQAPQPEPKTVWTFLSQGAVGCAIGYFILIAGYTVYAPDNSNVLFCIALAAIFVFAAVCGAFVGFFVWLTGAIFKRRLNAIHRTLAIGGAMMLWGLGFSRLISHTSESPLPLIWSMFLTCVVYAPIVFITGSNIRPAHLLIFGVGPYAKRHNVGDWLAYPAGFLLRAASILGFFEALLLVVLWLGSRRVDTVDYPSTEHMPAIIAALLYFFLSSYFSVATPRKAFVLLTAILVNLPLLVLLGYVRQFTGEARALSYPLFMLIGLWVVYTLGRLIAPEPPAQEINSTNVAVTKKAIDQRFTVYP